MNFCHLNTLYYNYSRFIFLNWYIYKKLSRFSIMYFADKIFNIFHYQYLNIFEFVFICKACRITFYEQTVTITLDMPSLYSCSFAGKLGIFLITSNWLFWNVFSFVRRVELCSHLFFLLFFLYFLFFFLYFLPLFSFYFFFFLFPLFSLYNCYIDIVKFDNISLNDLWNLCYHNFIILSFLRHIVLVTMKSKYFSHAWLPIDKHKLCS